MSRVSYYKPIEELEAMVLSCFRRQASKFFEDMKDDPFTDMPIAQK